MPLVGLLFASQLVVTAAAAEGPPAFDLGPTCRASESVEIESPKSCQEDEQAAREQLTKQWTKFSAADRTMCSDLTAGFDPSYVELLSCLETMQQARELPAEDSTQGSGK